MSMKVFVEGLYEIVSVDSVEESGNFTSIKELAVFKMKPVYVTPNITNRGNYHIHLANYSSHMFHLCQQ